jgi:hypothetical protein
MSDTIQQARFTADLWAEIVSTIAQVHRLTDEERSRFAKAPVPKLIAAIPFVAGCESPQRTAIAHLGTYLAAMRVPAFNHKPTDRQGIYSRFAPIMTFQGGSENIIMAGMARLALVSYYDHVRDQADDSITGKYNPVTAKEWDENTRAEFEDAAMLDVPELDGILTVPETVNAFWDF